jgi:hypothetical protein
MVEVVTHVSVASQDHCRHHYAILEMRRETCVALYKKSSQASAGSYRWWDQTLQKMPLAVDIIHVQVHIY